MNEYNHRPPEALPAPKQGEYPTGFFTHLSTMSVIGLKFCELNLQTRYIFSGDLGPQRPEDDELMKDLTEDELKAAFRC